MREMDLIPEDYRRIQITRKLLIVFGLFFVLVILALASGKIVLESKVSVLEEQIKIFEKNNQNVIEQQKINTDLKGRKAAIENQFDFVKLLQEGGGADQIFLIFDRVLGMEVAQDGQRNVWMDAWNYKAANLISKKDKEREQKMMISVQGRARDHEALSIFVERLIEQPEINDVQVKNTSMVGTDTSTVVFSMEIM